MVDDHVGYDPVLSAQRGDVVPRAQARVGLGVVLRVESRVRPVIGAIERQHVHAAEKPVQRAVEQSVQPVQVAAETVRVRDQLNLGWHATPHYPSG